MWKSKKYPCGCEVRLAGNPTPAQFDAAHNTSCRAVERKTAKPTTEVSVEESNEFLRAILGQNAKA
jgi:hypothetical protein